MCGSVLTESGHEWHQSQSQQDIIIIAVTVWCNKQSEKSHVLFHVKKKTKKHTTLGIYPVEVNRAYTLQTPLQNVKDM